jgi:hypothetical protein
MYLNRLTLIGFIGGDAETKTIRNAPPFLSGQTSPNQERRAESILSPPRFPGPRFREAGATKRADTPFATGKSATGVRRRNRIVTGTSDLSTTKGAGR